MPLDILCSKKEEKNDDKMIFLLLFGLFIDKFLRKFKSRIWIKQYQMTVIVVTM
jgi:hypothetical protein